MDLRDKIINNRDFKTCMERIEAFEKDRVFCKHDMEHLLSVARIAYCISLERGNDLSKDLIYSAALLHDIGRARQYETGQPHEEAGVELSREILSECGATKEQTDFIIDAIASHRGQGDGLISEADNLSRACFDCKVRSECKWDHDRMNLNIEY